MDGRRPRGHLAVHDRRAEPESWAEPFETKDLDIVAGLPTTESGLLNLAPVWEFLMAEGATPDGQFVRIGRLLVDFVPARDALDDEALAEAVTVQVGTQTVRVFRPEHAVAIALRTWRGKDREHIDRLIRTGRQPPDIPRLQAILHRYGLEERCSMSIWDEPLTKDEYMRRLLQAKAEQRKRDAALSFEESIVSPRGTTAAAMMRLLPGSK